MQLVFVVFLSLLLSIFSLSIWQGVEHFCDDAHYYFQAEEHALLLDGLVWYGIAILAQDHLMRRALEDGPVRRHESPWRGHVAGYEPIGSLSYTKNELGKYVLVASLRLAGDSGCERTIDLGWLSEKGVLEIVPS